MVGKVITVGRIENLPIDTNLWLLGRRIRVRRFDVRRWKVIPHEANGKGWPLRFKPVDSAIKAWQQVVEVQAELLADRVMSGAGKGHSVGRKA